MSEKKKIETKIIEYYRKFVEPNIHKNIERINNDNYYTDLVKIPFTYYDYSAPISFAPNPIDFAIYGVKEKKVVAIEYPWRLKNGDLTYNRIEL